MIPNLKNSVTATVTKVLSKPFRIHDMWKVRVEYSTVTLRTGTVFLLCLNKKKAESIKSGSQIDIMP